MEVLRWVKDPSLRISFLELSFERVVRARSCLMDVLIVVPTAS